MGANPQLEPERAVQRVGLGREQQQRQQQQQHGRRQQLAVVVVAVFSTFDNSEADLAVGQRHAERARQPTGRSDAELLRSTAISNELAVELQSDLIVDD